MRVSVVIFVAFAFACAASASSSADDNKYEASIYGMQGLRVYAKTPSQADFTLRHGDLPGFDFLKAQRNGDIEVLVAADQVDQFKRDLKAQGIEHEVFVEDVSKVIEESFALQKVTQKRQRALRSDGINLKTFPRYDSIVAYLKHLNDSRPEIASYFTIGKTFEGREIPGIKISSGGDNKPALVIDAGIHAREWIAPTTALYAIQKLVENANNSYIFKDIDIYIIPVLNVDGYEYTHQSPRTRMWRKSRSTNSNSNCLGTDLNRNFGYKWMTGGASDNPCSDTFAGTSEFSELESQALRDFILTLKDRIKVYLTLHSYGNYLLHPWGYTSDLPENEPTLRCVAEKAASQLSKSRGTRYTIGSSTNVLYVASGGSDDWSMAEGGAELAYTVELPGGFYGFAPPPREIIPTGRETFEAIKTFAQYAEGQTVC